MITAAFVLAGIVSMVCGASAFGQLVALRDADIDARATSLCDEGER